MADSLRCHWITHDQRHTLEKHPINVTHQPFGKPRFMTKGTIRNTDTFGRRLNIRNVYIGTLRVMPIGTMKLLIKLLTILTFILAWTSVSAHKDRIERPKTYRLTFQDGHAVMLDNTNKPTLTSYCTDIVNGKRKLIKAELTFGTGETLTFEGDGNKWKSIQIADSKNKILVPKLTTEKVPMIHFQTIALLWDGRDEKAFMASYLYIRFDIGNEKTFDTYPELQLSFSDNKFQKSVVWRQTSETSRQRGDL